MTKKRNIAVLSDGGFGTALALHLINNGHNVRQWGPFPEYIAEMNLSRKNPRFLPAATLPNNLVLCEKMFDVVDGAEIVLLASPSQYLRGVLEVYKKYYQPQHLLVNIAKGIENNTLLRMSEVTEEILGKNLRYVCMSGPSHAEEVFNETPTALVVASANEKDAIEVQDAFMNDTFRVYTSPDLVGLELGGSIKNVYAIAAGIIDGMKLGDNPKAALVTRAIEEVKRMGMTLGGLPETFAGLSGLGDMCVTCYSGHSRNRHVGEELGRGKKLAQIKEEMGLSVAEGVFTALSAYQLAQKLKVETPIINKVYEVLYQDKNPREALIELMSRKPKAEIEHT